MADIEIGYKGSTIASMSSSGTTTLDTAGTYCEDDITITYDKVQGSAFTPATTISVTPTISIDSNGLITANNSGTSSITPTVTAGYITSGTAGTVTVNGSNTSQLNSLAASTWTPTTTSQTISSGIYLTGNQTIAGDSNLLASNIASGVSIFGVNGTFQGGGDLKSITINTINLSSQSTTFSSSNLLVYQNDNYNNSTTISTNDYYSIWFDPFISIELNEQIHLYMELSLLCSDIDETITIDSDYTVKASVESLTFTSSSQNSNINAIRIYYVDNNLRFSISKKSGSYLLTQINGQIIITKVINGMDTVTIDLGENPFFRNIYKSLAYRSLITSDAAGVSEWCNSLSNIRSCQFAGQPFSGTFNFNNVSYMNAEAFGVPTLGAGNLGGSDLIINFPSLTSMLSSAFLYNSKITEIYASQLSIIPSCAFYSCERLTTASFPECTSISNSAFFKCPSLTTISFSKCTTIGVSAFCNCNNLTTASFPMCSYIKGSAFQYCGKLNSIYFPECTVIENLVFQNCYSLTTISFSKCTDIGASAFYNCSNLTIASFPVCSYIKQNTFYNCYSLATIFFPECTAIESSAFYNCSNLTIASFSKCTTIGSNVFTNCYNLITASFPSCLQIGGTAFRSCYNLTIISFPLCSMIFSYAFSQCSNLSVISFPNVKSMSAYVFQQCSKLESAYFMGRSIPTVGTTIFAATPIANSTYLGYFGSIYVPSSLLASYKTATNWTTYSSRMVGV